MKFYVSAYPVDSKKAILKMVLIARNSFEAAKLAFCRHEFQEDVDISDECRVNQKGFKRHCCDEIYTCTEILASLEEQDED